MASTKQTKHSIPLLDPPGGPDHVARRPCEQGKIQYANPVLQAISRRVVASI
jgi:hypothetical protein